MNYINVMPILAAVVAFSSCAKEELLQIEDDSINTEITFQVAPVTKSAADSFSSTSVFETNAYYLTSDSKWSTSAADGVEYIHMNTVSWENNAWRLERSCNWPKAGGNLTFYSWTLNRDNLDFNPASDALVSIDPVKGVCLNHFDISLDGDMDFMVATAAQNKTESTSSSVTTQFKHQLSRVKMTARTSADYSREKEISITSIVLKGIAKEADYQQSRCENGIWSEINQWTVTETEDAVYGDYSSDPQIITSEAKSLSSERMMFIPQSFTEGSEYLQVSYTIKDIYSGLVEDVTEHISLASITDDCGFVNGKLYSMNITIGLDSIHWDPSVGDWEDAK